MQERRAPTPSAEQAPTFHRRGALVPMALPPMSQNAYNRSALRRNQARANLPRWRIQHGALASPCLSEKGTRARSKGGTDGAGALISRRRYRDCGGNIGYRNGVSRRSYGELAGNDHRRPKRRQGEGRPPRKLRLSRLRESASGSKSGAAGAFGSQRTAKYRPRSRDGRPVPGAAAAAPMWYRGEVARRAGARRRKARIFSPP